ncbi:MAG: biotin transporter BioY [Proteobacteria bacterium]|nr:biotin transporter BioY [Pseudomonadota bacterium]
MQMIGTIGAIREVQGLRRVALALAGSLLLAVSAQITVPMVPVPMTMQTLALLLIGASFGARRAVEASLLYLAEGAMGLPVFAGGAAGIHHLAGPTAGFLFGFVAAAWLIGALFDRGWGRNVMLAAAALMLGHLLLFVPGIFWLAKFIGPEAAFIKGFALFIPGTLVKTVLALALLYAGARARR